MAPNHKGEALEKNIKRGMVLQKRYLFKGGAGKVKVNFSDQIKCKNIGEMSISRHSRYAKFKIFPIMVEFYPNLLHI